jgi:rhodanese-related sulfurtransferase
MTFDKGPFLTAYLNEEGVPELGSEELFALRSPELQIIDVRRPEEVSGELGHIEGSKRLTLETEFASGLTNLDPQGTYVFVCRSGARSSRAAAYALDQGFARCFNLAGGMIAWNRNQFPVSKSQI